MDQDPLGGYPGDGNTEGNTNWKEEKIEERERERNMRV